MGSSDNGVTVAGNLVDCQRNLLDTAGFSLNEAVALV